MPQPSLKELFAKRFPNKVGVVSTHHATCWRDHPECAYALGVKDAIKAMEERFNEKLGFLS